ncbi:hypothetical protein [Streptomyces sp. NPDC048659]|uniref:hypothetical protein n=1 Tax=Streptomyces sp. NPDC048659 TaxID=3155489 RepID=UPI003421CC2E
MGRLRTSSFFIFHDPDAPTAVTFDKAQIEEIEAAHEEAKNRRIKELVRRQLGIYIPELRPAKTAAERLHGLDRQTLVAVLTRKIEKKNEEQHLKLRVERLAGLSAETLATRITEVTAERVAKMTATGAGMTAEKVTESVLTGWSRDLRSAQLSDLSAEQLAEKLAELIASWSADQLANLSIDLRKDLTERMENDPPSDLTKKQIDELHAELRAGLSAEELASLSREELAGRLAGTTRSELIRHFINMSSVLSVEQIAEQIAALSAEKLAKLGPRRVVRLLGDLDDEILFKPDPALAGLLDRVKAGRWTEEDGAEVVRLLGILDDPGVTEEDVKAAQERSRRAEDTEAGQKLLEIVRAIQEIGDDEAEFGRYRSRVLLPNWRDTTFYYFGTAVFDIVTSKAEYPSNHHVPNNTLASTVRFKEDEYFGIGDPRYGQAAPDDPDKETDQQRRNREQNWRTRPAVWMKVADGAWAKDGNWGGFLQITCVTAKGQWVSSKNGWMAGFSRKADVGVSFYDMGHYYEIWQGTREDGKPLVVEDDGLRFVKDATPGRWNIVDRSGA